MKPHWPNFNKHPKRKPKTLNMNQITPYLNFNGNCREAMEYYAQCLGANLNLQTVAESPLAGEFPADKQGQVVHATLSHKNRLLLMGSDMCCPDDGWVPGNTFSLSYSCTKDEIHELFEKLSEGGRVVEPVKRQFWGDLFCNFVDKWGVRWAINAVTTEQRPNFEILRFSILINAPRERIWEVLLEDNYYRLWTAAFHPGSFAEGDWTEGSTVYFKSPEGDGMISRVVVHIPSEIISLEHQGVLRNNEEIFDAPDAVKWKGAREIYRLRDELDGTRLFIDQDIAPEYLEYMTKAWEQALENVKNLAEAVPVTA